MAAATREFKEETGFDVQGAFIPLAPVTQKGGKKVYGWAVAGDIDAEALQSNTFTLEWPPGSGKRKAFPEVDRGGWFGLREARAKINPAQTGFLDELEQMMK
jgi:predicted NUDIX family NTP pyrophosphohydrolase